MIVIPILAAAVLVASFLVLLGMALFCPAQETETVDDEPQRTWPGPDYGPWGKRS